MLQISLGKNVDAFRRIENYSDRVELDDELLALTDVYFLLDVCLSAGRW